MLNLKLDLLLDSFFEIVVQRLVVGAAHGLRGVVVIGAVERLHLGVEIIGARERFDQELVLRR